MVKCKRVLYVYVNSVVQMWIITNTICFKSTKSFIEMVNLDASKCIENIFVITSCPSELELNCKEILYKLLMFSVCRQKSLDRKARTSMLSTSESKAADSTSRNVVPYSPTAGIIPGIKPVILLKIHWVMVCRRDTHLAHYWICFWNLIFKLLNY